MIPQSVKDILGNGENVGLFQSIALFLFLFFFLGIIFYVFSRPKKHYEEQENAPLNDDIVEDIFNSEK